MHEEQSVAEMATEVLRRQAHARAEQTGEPFQEAFEAVLGTEAGRRLEELRDGPHGEEGAREWQEDVRQERAAERRTEGRDR